MATTRQLVDNLAQLPTELVLGIINDLRVWDVVKLMLRNDPKINSYLLAHQRCKDFLGQDAEALATTRERVQAYLSFAEQWHLPLGLPHDSVYEHPLFDNRRDWDIVQTVHYRVWQTLPISAHELLTPYAKRPGGIPKVTISSSLEEYGQFMDTMMEAKTVLSRKCFGQISRAAAMLKENPDILKRTADPEQKQRPNTYHMVSRMKRTAEAILSRSARDFRTVEQFRYEFFPIIPFDHSLRYLLRMMEKHRMTAGDQILAESGHPPSMMNFLQIVVGGMPCFYPLDPEREVKKRPNCATNAKGDVLRTQNTPWSDKPISDKHKHEAKGVRFMVSKGSYLWEWNRKRGFQGLEPHSPREEEWIMAFVELYRYLEALENSSEEGT